MFDWLFGTKRQTNFDDTKSLYDKYNDANSSANDYYNKNIANVDWNSLGRDEQIKRANEFNRLDDQRSALGGQYDKTYNTYNQENKDRQHDYFGNGVLGALLNPAAQTATAIGDLVTGNYDTKKRDVASDIGAGVETALGLIPFGGGLLAKAGGGLGKAGAAIKAASETVPGMALSGAGIGAAEAYRQKGGETELGDALNQAGTGALFGGAFPLAQKAGGKFLAKRGAANYNPEAVYSGLSQVGVTPLQAAMMAADPSTKTLQSVGMHNLMPKTLAGKAALGGGALFGGSKLLGGLGGGSQQTLQQQQESESDSMNQLARQIQQQYGYTPNYQGLQEIMQRMQGRSQY
jgi:hypothetical protein|nr:MAG TPA: hypothetical protein [Caudoviricetes sp.]